MPIRIPADAKVVSCKQVDLVRIIGTLNDRLVEGDGGLKAKVRSTLEGKGASYATSDLVIAELRPGTAKNVIDPAAVFALVKARKITLEQFLSTVTIGKGALEKFLGKDAIAALTRTGPAGAPALFTEFRDGVTCDLEQLGEQLAAALGRVAKVVPITAA